MLCTHTAGVLYNKKIPKKQQVEKEHALYYLTSATMNIIKGMQLIFGPLIQSVKNSFLKSPYIQKQNKMHTEAKSPKIKEKAKGYSVTIKMIYNFFAK